MSQQMVEWRSRSSQQRRELLARPPAQRSAKLRDTVLGIIASVRQEGDAALRRFTREFDNVDLASSLVSQDEYAEAESSLADHDRDALDIAIDNVRRFHAAQRLPVLDVETYPGVRCEQRTIPIRSVGLYVPAGTAPLPSTAIMLAVPAALAGCRERVVCTPPQPDGRAAAAVLYVARRCEVTRVYKVGGAQAIAALAYGTREVSRVDKIFGPGNAWVAAAKELVAADPAGAAIDLPAGPSEVLVIADSAAHAEHVAADLLAQAEHGADAQVLLVTPSARLAQSVLEEVEAQLQRLQRHGIARQAMQCSRFVVVESLAEAFEVSNAYAPEHLILHVASARRWLGRVEAAGSVFLGPWSPETIGDYCSGANHVLPTGGAARAWSGLSLLDFTRRITVQELTGDGLRRLGPVAETLAALEGLEGHAKAVAVRLKTLGDRQ